MNLSIFKENDFLPALKALFKDLKVPMNYVADEPTSAKEILKDSYKDNDTFQLIDDVYFVGMVDDAAFEGNKSLETDKIKSDYDGILIFGITLRSRPNRLLPTRSQLAEISRAFNREFYYTPVVVVFKYENYLAFANTERLKYKQEWREGEKAGKVSLLRDIHIENPHSGHERILAELQIPTTGTKKVDSFAKLYAYWQNVFSVSLLNKKFYQELSNWYFWAIQHVTFPGEPTIADAYHKKAKLEDLLQEHKATNVIRMLTRLLFVWFIKEKKLIPEELFELDALQKDILNEISPYHEIGIFKERNKESIYYKAILQNLFFATLNCPIEGDSLDKRKRGFRGDGYGTHRGIDYLMRYKQYFKNPDAFLEKLNQTVPFLNGGLFECLDDKFNNLYIDGFSDQMTKGEQLIVPDYLFFGVEEEADLSDIIGIKNKKYKQAAVKGLINILKSYKFTITENTPIEEDVALDPELLGKVFENLLASYNPETKTTARKQTGSFYTPREIVNYMVDESLIAYLKNVLEASSFEYKKANVLEASSFEHKNAFETPFLDPNDEIEIKQGNLPHWYQPEVFYHVTFRLADSIPKEKVEQLKVDRENWHQKHKNKKEFSKEEWKEYNRLFNQRVEEWMNSGYGSCLLKKRENAEIIANALKYFEGQRYDLDEWVVMPNHVHVLVKPKKEFKLSDILHSWKSFTANEINKKENRTGQLWMHESYDHIVRNEDALKAIRYYIRQNPIKAGIVAKASSFEQEKTQSRDGLDTLQDKLQSKDALDTMLHQLVSFDNINPYKDNEKATREIITALSTCTILDPACGSGAFPMGILQKMVHILQKLDPDNKVWKEVQLEKARKESEAAFEIEDKQAREERLLEINEAFDQSINDPDYARKLFLIENCIYGVDIQPIAVQISKLRFFISLVVEQKPSDKPKNNFNIRPLPNLETKFVAANTLIGIKKDGGLFETDEVKKLENELKIVRHKIFSLKSKERKIAWREKDKELREQLSTVLKHQGLPLDAAEKLAGWDPYDQNASSPFFDSEWMFGIKEGFDVVIGNPPYIRKTSLTEREKKLYDKIFITAYKQYDLYILFTEKGFNLLNINGLLCYIKPTNYLVSDYGFKLRELILKQKQILSVLDVSQHNVFISASTYPAVFLYKNTSLIDFGFKVLHHSNLTFKNEKLILGSPYEFSKSDFINDPEFRLILSVNRDELKILNQIELSSNNLGDYFETKRGEPNSRVHFTNDGLPAIQSTDVSRDLVKASCKVKFKKGFEDISTLYLKNSFIILPRTITKIYSQKSMNQIILDRIYFLVSKKSISQDFIQILINSQVIHYWFSAVYDSTRIRGGYFDLNGNQIKSIPLPKTIQSDVNSSILNKKKLNTVAESVVFECFFPDHMKERGIDVLEFVERDIKQVMQGREFEKLSDAEKEQVIEALHAKWSDPDNEVVKRMAMFKEKSPDILKPIIES